MRVIREGLLHLEKVTPSDPRSLLHFYSDWHECRELYRSLLDEMGSREHVLHSLGNRGFGVNHDLLAAVTALRTECQGADAWFDRVFEQGVAAVRDHVDLPWHLAAARRSDHIVTELCAKLGVSARDYLCQPEQEAKPSFDHYLHVMTHETPWMANLAIFRKMFLSMGTSSMTIMGGSIGLHNDRSCQELKVLANRNLNDACRTVFSRLGEPTDVNIGLLQELHHGLAKDLLPNAGRFRDFVFPDLNGVTFEYENFQREVDNIDVVLREIARSFDRLPDFIRDLARAYYLVIGVHPFWDSNGRAARCLVNHLLLKKGLPPVILDDGDEVLALPRYGGSMEDMHLYLQDRLEAAVDVYFHERWKLESLGNLHRPIHDVTFDSGFSFRQLGDQDQQVEIGFEVLVVDPRHGQRESLVDQCRVVLFDEAMLDDTTVYLGLSRGPGTRWRDGFAVHGISWRKEVASPAPGVRAFDVDVTVALPPGAQPGDHLSCAVTCEKAGLTFNNKGLNYSHPLGL